MKVHFTGSERNLREDMRYYRKIRQSIIDTGSTLSLDWIEDAYKNTKSKNTEDKRDWGLLHKNTLEALKAADVCIYEATERSFSIGFQTALALRMKKPVLVLSRNDSMRDSFGSGIVSDLLLYESYRTIDDIDNIVKKFIDSNNLQLNDLRFNFVIDREIHNYLRSAAFNMNTTKAEVIRELLRAKIHDSNN